MKTYTFTLIDKVWQTADESTKKLLDSARNDYKEMFDCYKEQAEGTTTTPSQERGGPSPETPSQQNCAQYGVKAAKTMNQVQDVTASKTKPNPGDPLVNMLVQGTDPNNPNNRIGGTYGCVRHTPTQKKQNCSNWEKNIINFPHITGKNKVHDGVDLTASTRTPVYAMFDGMAVTGFSSDLGNYVRIHSSSKEHKLHFESNTIWTSYAHLDSYINQINGKFVKQGDLIGYSGNSGKIAEKIDKWQYHLHVTIYQGSQDKYHRINPINYFTSKFDNNGNKIK